MDGMTAKEFLLQPARARVRLEMALLRRDALKSLTERVTQTIGIQTPGCHSQNYSAMEDAVIRLTEAEEMVERRMEELAKAELKVGDVLVEVAESLLEGLEGHGGLVLEDGASVHHECADGCDDDHCVG